MSAGASDKAFATLQAKAALRVLADVACSRGEQGVGHAAQVCIGHKDDDLAFACGLAPAQNLSLVPAGDAGAVATAIASALASHDV